MEKRCFIVHECDEIIVLTTIVIKIIISLQEVVIGLTRHGRLYVNNKEIANNCSSFFVHDEFLLITTTSHLLRCFSILSDGKGANACILCTLLSMLSHVHLLCTCFSILNYFHPFFTSGIVSILTNTDVREHVRNVERGSKIILAVPRDTKLILQVRPSKLECEILLL